jgi:hypothetical protein
MGKLFQIQHFKKNLGGKIYIKIRLWYSLIIEQWPILHNLLVSI